MQKYVCIMYESSSKRKMARVCIGKNDLYQIGCYKRFISHVKNDIEIDRWNSIEISTLFVWENWRKNRFDIKHEGHATFVRLLRQI